jgi:toxin HigB-1
LPKAVQTIGRRKLRMLNNASQLQELRVPPNNQLEKLKGDRAGQFSLRVNNQWRVCFAWDDGDAYAVEITDYH